MGLNFCGGSFILHGTNRAKFVLQLKFYSYSADQLGLYLLMYKFLK